MNERFRFLKYNPGGFFKPHCDGRFSRPNTLETSAITLHMYLNDVKSGGQTRFFDLNDELGLKSLNKAKNKYYDTFAKCGRIALFRQELNISQ